jgi:predicted alpha/beta superfamily hydrolase
MRSLHSDVTGTDYRIYVALPPDYATNKDARYPVVYLVDGDALFSPAIGALNILVYGKLARGAILVGIGYQLLSQRSVLRSAELTPTRWPVADSALSKEYGSEVRSGGADKFLLALKTEIVPFVEETYRVSPERMLAGYSFGGLFGAYVLFHEPSLFKDYLLGSPSLAWDTGVVFQYESQYAAAHKDLPARVFLSCGSLEDARMIGPVQKMIETLKGRNYGGLQLTDHEFDGETHISGIPTAISRGLRVLLASGG